MEEEQVFRVILIGDTGVGKSCLLLRFSENKFTEDHDVTLGVEFGTRCLKLDNQSIKLQIWDTAGQESFRSITRSFYRRADGVILVYDITARHTFENCTHWIQEIHQNGNQDAVIFLIGNQADLLQEGELPEVSNSDAKDFMNKHKLAGFIETSAKSGLNVEEAFSSFCRVLVKKWKEGRTQETEKSLVLSFNDKNKQKKKKCC